MEDVPTKIYDPRTLISIHTCKPIEQPTNPVDSTTKYQPPVFWCDVCHHVCRTPVAAVQHLSGRAHKSKVNGPKSSEDGVQNNALKRKIDGVEGSSEGYNRKIKVKKDGENVGGEEELKCETCDREFKTCLQAVHHFKGKKHASKMESAYKQKQVQEKPDANLRCDDCDKEFANAVVAVQHFKGKRHAQRLESLSKEKKGVEKTDPCLKCEVCDKAFNTSLIALQHFQGRKHAVKVESVSKKKKPENDDSNLNNLTSGEKKVSNVEPVSKKKKEAEKDGSSLKCEDCDKTFTSDTLAIAHFKGKKHATKVASKVIAGRNRGQLGGGQRGRGRRNGGFDRGFGSYGNSSRGKPLTGLQGYANNDYGANYSDSSSWYPSFDNTRSGSNYFADAPRVHTPVCT